MDSGSSFVAGLIAGVIFGIVIGTMTAHKDESPLCVKESGSFWLRKKEVVPCGTAAPASEQQKGGE